MIAEMNHHCGHHEMGSAKREKDCKLVIGQREELKGKLHTMRQELKSFKKANQEWDEWNELQKSEMDRKTKELRLLKKRHTALREEMNNVREELETLKLAKQAPDVQNYRKWTADQFMDWITNIDEGSLKPFKQYEHSLRRAFLKDGINGVAIPHIKESHWEQWGVASFVHRALLDKHLKNLVDGTYRSTKAVVEGQSTMYL